MRKRDLQDYNEKKKKIYFYKKVFFQYKKDAVLGQGKGMERVALI